MDITEGTYIKFLLMEPKQDRKTKQWQVANKEMDDVLGLVSWYAPWRKYTFSPANYGMVFEQVCLREIADFIEAQTKAHREQREREKAQQDLSDFSSVLPAMVVAATPIVL